jgi:hypothetical protein
MELVFVSFVGTFVMLFAALVDEVSNSSARRHVSDRQAPSIQENHARRGHRSIQPETHYDQAA